MIGLYAGVSFALCILIGSLPPLIFYESESMSAEDRAQAMKELVRLPTRETFDFIIGK